jgi:hypothetical protein
MAVLHPGREHVLVPDVNHTRFRRRAALLMLLIPAWCGMQNAGRSLTDQEEIGCGPDGAICADAIDHFDPKAIGVEVDDPHIGRRVTVDWGWPVDHQVEDCSSHSANEAGCPDPRARVRAGDPAGSGIQNEVGADRSGHDQIGPTGPAKGQTGCALP